MRQQQQHDTSLVNVLMALADGLLKMDSTLQTFVKGTNERFAQIDHRLAALEHPAPPQSSLSGRPLQHRGGVKHSASLQTVENQVRRRDASYGAPFQHTPANENPHPHSQQQRGPVAVNGPGHPTREDSSATMEAALQEIQRKLLQMQALRLHGSAKEPSRQKVDRDEHSSQSSERADPASDSCVAPQRHQASTLSTSAASQPRASPPPKAHAPWKHTVQRAANEADVARGTSTSPQVSHTSVPRASHSQPITEPTRTSVGRDTIDLLQHVLNPPTKDHRSKSGNLESALTGGAKPQRHGGAHHRIEEWMRSSTSLTSDGTSKLRGNDSANTSAVYNWCDNNVSVSTDTAHVPPYGDRV